MVARAFYPCAAVTLNGGSSSNWDDIDVSSYVSSDATGVLLYFVNGAGGDRNWGVRRKGCTDSRGGSCGSGNWHGWAFIGIDSDKKFQFYNVDSTPRVGCYLYGYVTAGVDFTPSYTSAPDISPAAGSWQSVDLSAHIPSGTLGVIIETYRTGGTGIFGYRVPGSTDNYTGSIGTYHTCFGFISGVSSDRKIELYRSSTSVKFYLTAFITDGAYFYADKVDAVPGGWPSGWTAYTSPTASVVPFLELFPAGYAEASGTHGPGQTTKIFGGHAFATPGECFSNYTLFDSIGGGTAWLTGFAYGYSSPTVQTDDPTNIEVND